MTEETKPRLTLGAQAALEEYLSTVRAEILERAHLSAMKASAGYGDEITVNDISIAVGQAHHSGPTGSISGMKRNPPYPLTVALLSVAVLVVTVLVLLIGISYHGSIDEFQSSFGATGVGLVGILVGLLSALASIGVQSAARRATLQRDSLSEATAVFLSFYNRLDLIIRENNSRMFGDSMTSASAVSLAASSGKYSQSQLETLRELQSARNSVIHAQHLFSIEQINAYTRQTERLIRQIDK